MLTSANEHERAEMERFTCVQLWKRFVIGYYCPTPMNANLYYGNDMDWSYVDQVTPASVEKSAKHFVFISKYVKYSDDRNDYTRTALARIHTLLSFRCP